MTKKNTTKLDLQKHFSILVQRYLALTEDYIYSIERLNKKHNYFFKNEDNTDEDHKEMFFYQDKINNTINASFTYSFSIFEIFLKEILSSGIKHNKTIKERYFGKWDKLIESGEHKKYGISSKILRDANKQFENYDILISYEKSTLMEFMHSIFSIKKPKEGTFFSGYIAYYNLSREVRNTLTHRGDKFDQKLIDSLKNNKSLKDNPSYLEEFYKRHTETKNKKKLVSVNAKALIGETIRIDFIRTISCLMYLAAWFALSLNEESDETGSIIVNKYNDINNFVHKHECAHLLTMSMRLFLTHKKHLCDDDINKTQDFDKVNYLLTHDLHTQLVTKSYNKFRNNINKNLPSDKSKELNKAHKELVEKIKQKNSSTIEKYFVFSSLDKNLQELLRAYLNDDFKSFIKITKIIKPEKTELDDWFIYKKYFNKKEFKILYQQTKNK
ncbi:hypothetical protein N9W80_01270 [Gammaproteobacteria bacterium]|nr:hypothetical protein [Gammaproteobacteria bacterium]